MLTSYSFDGNGKKMGGIHRSPVDTNIFVRTVCIIFKI